MIIHGIPTQLQTMIQSQYLSMHIARATNVVEKPVQNISCMITKNTSTTLKLDSRKDIVVYVKSH
jgi:hypothetical protein